MSLLSISYAQSGISSAVIADMVQRLRPEIERLSDVLQNTSDSPESFISLPFDEQMRKHVHDTVTQMRAYNPQVFLLLGIGGSNLGTLAVTQALTGKFYNLLYPDIAFYYADTVDTDFVWDLVRVIEDHFERGHEVILNVVSKSGTTLETAANFQLFLELLKRYKGEVYPNYIVATTDRDSQLWHFAQEHAITCLEIPKLVGGRFSVLSAAALFPLALLGIDIDALCEGACNITDSLMSYDIDHNHAVLMAAIVAHQYAQGLHIHNSFFFTSDLELVGAWYRQLVGESLGKQHIDGTRVGIMPVVSMGSTDLHSVGQLYLGGSRTVFTTFISVKNNVSDVAIGHMKEFNQYMPYLRGKTYAQIMNAILLGTKSAYMSAQLPYISIELPEKNAYYMGQFLQLHMMHVVYLGYLLGVNPFDQPHVELYKKETRKILAHE